VIIRIVFVPLFANLTGDDLSTPEFIEEYSPWKNGNIVYQSRERVVTHQNKLSDSIFISEAFESFQVPLICHIGGFNLYGYFMVPEHEIDFEPGSGSPVTDGIM
jgi:hypothetical protein